MAGDAERTFQQSAGWRYRCLTRIISVVFIAHAIWKTLLTRDSRFLKERLGFVPSNAALVGSSTDQSAKRSLHWWHATSVGEIQTVWPLLQTIVAQSVQKEPHSAWLLTRRSGVLFVHFGQRSFGAEARPFVFHLPRLRATSAGNVLHFDQ